MRVICEEMRWSHSNHSDSYQVPGIRSFWLRRSELEPRSEHHHGNGCLALATISLIRTALDVYAETWDKISLLRNDKDCQHLEDIPSF